VGISSQVRTIVKVCYGYSYFIYERFSFKFAKEIHNNNRKLIAVEYFKVLIGCLNSVLIQLVDGTRVRERIVGIYTSIYEHFELNNFVYRETRTFRCTLCCLHR